jgi:hypothetical protein
VALGQVGKRQVVEQVVEKLLAADLEDEVVGAVAGI